MTSAVPINPLSANDSTQYEKSVQAIMNHLFKYGYIPVSSGTLLNTEFSRYLYWDYLENLGIIKRDYGTADSTIQLTKQTLDIIGELNRGRTR